MKPANKWVGSIDRLGDLLDAVRTGAAHSGTDEEHRKMVANKWIRRNRKAWLDLTPKGRSQLWACKHPCRHTSTD